jgi:type I restriction enzyme S subunit
VPHVGYDRHFKYLRRLEIRAPSGPNSLGEQKRLAAILDHADGIRRKRQQALRLADEFLRSVFLDMFGDPVANPKGWSVDTLQKGVESFDGGWNVLPTETERSDGCKVLKVSAVTSGEYRPEESKSFAESVAVPQDYLVREGDLIISRANTAELVGAAAYVWSTDTLRMLPDKLWRFVWKRPQVLDPLFMLHLARSSYFRDQLIQRASGSSGSMKNIGKAKMMEIPIPYPPIALQNRFSAIVRSTRHALDRAKAAALESESLFQSLQHRAFSGQL